MSQLATLLNEVKEQNLTKTQLEAYHTDLTNLYGQMMLEVATLEKAEALYFLENKKDAEGKERTDISIKRMWRGTDKGQRLIELKSFEKAITKVLSSLKNRIYAIY